MAFDLNISTRNSQQRVDKLAQSTLKLGDAIHRATNQARALDSAFGRSSLQAVTGVMRDLRSQIDSLRAAQDRILASQRSMSETARVASSGQIQLSTSIERGTKAAVESSAASNRLSAATRLMTGSVRDASRTLEAATAATVRNTTAEQIAARAKAATAGVKKGLVGATLLETNAVRGNIAATEASTGADLRNAAAKRGKAAAADRSAASMALLNSQLRWGAQAAAGFRAALYASNSGIGIFTGQTVLFAASVYGLVAGIKASITTGAEFERTYRRAIIVMGEVDLATGQVAEGAAALHEEIRLLGQTTQFTATQVAEAASELGMAGLKADQALYALNATLNLSAIGMLDLGKSADIVTNLMASFRIQAQDIMGVVDVMAMAITNSNMTVEQLAHAMSYVGPAASVAGGTIEETVAALMLLHNAGIKGSLAGTGLRRMFVNLVDPTTKGAKTLERLGVATRDVYGNMRSLMDIMADLGSEGATSADLIRIFGVRAFSAVATVVRGANGELQRTHQMLMEVQGASDNMRRELEQNLSVAFLTLKSAIQEVQLTAFDAFGASVTEQVREFTDTIRANTEKLAKIVASAATTVVNAVVFVADNIRTVAALVTLLVGRKLITSFAGLAVAMGTRLVSASTAMAASIHASNTALSTGTAVTLRHTVATTASAAAVRGKKAALTAMATAATLAQRPLMVLTALGRGLLALVGGPLGLAVTGLSVALSIVSFRALGASKAFDEMTGALYRTTEEVNALTRAGLTKHIEDVRKDLNSLTSQAEAKAKELAALREMAARDPAASTSRRSGQFSGVEELTAIMNARRKLAEQEVTLEAEIETLRKQGTEAASKLAYAEELLNAVRARGVETGNELAGIQVRHTDVYENLVDSLHEVTHTTGLSTDALLRYRFAYGDLSNSIEIHNGHLDEEVMRLRELQKSHEGDAEALKLLDQLVNDRIESIKEEHRQIVLNASAVAEAVKTTHTMVQAYHTQQGTSHAAAEALRELANAQAQVADDAFLAWLQAAGITLEEFQASLTDKRERTIFEAVEQHLSAVDPLFRELTGTISDLNSKTLTYAEAMDKARDFVSALTQDEAERARVLEQIGAALKKMELDSYTKALEDAWGQVLKNVEADQRLILGLDEELKLMRMSELERRTHIELRKLSAEASTHEAEEIRRKVRALYEEEQAQRALAAVTDVARDLKMTGMNPREREIHDLNQLYEDRLFIIEEAFQREQISYQDHHRLLEEAKRQHNDAMDALDKARWMGQAQMVADVMDNIGQAMMQGSRKQFERGKKFAMASAAINAALAATKALAEGGPYLGPALAVSIAALAGVQIEKIKQQEYQGYATGGLVRGKGGSTSDSIPAMLSDREYVIRAAAVSKYGTAFLDAINSRSLPVTNRATGGQVGAHVEPVGRAGEQVVVQIIDQRQGGEPAEVSEGLGPNGERQLRVLIRDEVKRTASDGSLDNVMSTRYGARVQGVRR